MRAFSSLFLAFALFLASCNELPQEMNESRWESKRPDIVRVAESMPPPLSYRNGEWVLLCYFYHLTSERSQYYDGSWRWVIPYLKWFVRYDSSGIPFDHSVAELGLVREDYVSPKEDQWSQRRWKAWLIPINSDGILDVRLRRILPNGAIDDFFAPKEFLSEIRAPWINREVLGALGVSISRTEEYSDRVIFFSNVGGKERIVAVRPKGMKRTRVFLTDRGWRVVWEPRASFH